MLDIGAGMGFYSLAAAAAGRSVEAIEIGSRNLASLKASVAYNNFSNLVTVTSPCLLSRPAFLQVKYRTKSQNHG